MKHWFVTAIALLALAACWTIGFGPPIEAERLRAIGRTDGLPSLLRLEEFAGPFFTMPVRLLPASAPERSAVTTRTNTLTRRPQVLTGDLLRLLRRKLPADAFCRLGITMDDRYPEPAGNFGFGQASLRERVGVSSFARYDPFFHGQCRGEDSQQVLGERSCKVLAHEPGHRFGRRHCIHFLCFMKGSNHLPESDSRPWRLCPVCLRKLRSITGFDVADRYRRLAEFYRRAGLLEESRWGDQRLRRIRRE